jgi:hypothetical protein
MLPVLAIFGLFARHHPVQGTAADWSVSGTCRLKRRKSAERRRTLLQILNLPTPKPNIEALPAIST